MKLLILSTFVATFCSVNGGKTERLLAALNAGLLTGMNGGVMAGMNGGIANRAVPGMLAGGLNPPMVAAGGAGFFGQPQFAQFVPGLPAFALPAPIPNAYPVPAVNTLPFMGVPQMGPMNPPQQLLPGITGGVTQQQLPFQPDPIRRFRRHIMTQDNTLKTSVDTQIPAPAEATPCDKEGRREEN